MRCSKSCCPCDFELVALFDNKLIEQGKYTIGSRILVGQDSSLSLKSENRVFAKPMSTTGNIFHRLSYTAVIGL